MEIYLYDNEGRFTVKSSVHESLMEDYLDNPYLFTTTIKPLPEKEGFDIIFNGEDWEYIKAKAPKYPPNAYSVLVDNKWIEDVDLKTEYFENITTNIQAEQKGKRDQLISGVTWRRERHNDEVLLGLEPTEPLLPILEYIQALRDVPQQEGFPEDIEWPVPPWEEEAPNE